jgi:hypothetical protein
MTDYEHLQESLAVTGKYLLPVMQKYSDVPAGALMDAFQAGIEYTITESKEL